MDLLQFPNVSLELEKQRWDTIFQVWPTRAGEVITFPNLLAKLLLTQPKAQFALVAADFTGVTNRGMKKLNTETPNHATLVY